MRTTAFAAVLAMMGAVPALASSEDAWDAFRANVETACLSAVDGKVEAAKIAVDPFGSEHYGIAVITGTSSETTGQPLSLICVYDKTTETAEVNLGFEADALEVTIPETK